MITSYDSISTIIKDIIRTYDIIYVDRIYDIDLSIKRRKDTLNRIPDHCGIYIIHTIKHKRYIGASNNIRHRIGIHIPLSGYSCVIPDAIKCIDVYLIDLCCKDELKSLEKKFIHKLKPELNKVGMIKIKRKWLWSEMIKNEI